MRNRKKTSHLIMIAIFAMMVFFILMITMLLVGSVVYVLAKTGIIRVPNLGVLLVTIAIASIVVGTILSAILGKIPMRPVYNLINGLNTLAAGNYNVRLDMKLPKAGKYLEDSFNILAEELQNTEMLRSDFVNNFSHEFKTPLVSIKGFARLLQKENLPEEKKQKYISIILEESSRLADMATKVLDLTKLENQSILTDVTEYNLSEQLRESILLLEKKWMEKELDISAEFGECQVYANQEMLKQVWINLLDNAIKYSIPGGTVAVCISRQEKSISVSVTNHGSTIKDEEKERIFHKFYQGENASTEKGNGIGLAIVRRIVELHNGAVQVDSKESQTTFTVTLPQDSSLFL